MFTFNNKEEEIIISLGAKEDMPMSNRQEGKCRMGQI